MFKVQASQSDSGLPYFITVEARFETREEALAAAAVFPKSLLVGAGTIALADHKWAYTAGLVVNLQPTKGNDRNEGGIKRYRSFLKHAAKNGFSVEFTRPNDRRGWMTEAEFETAIS